MTSEDSERAIRRLQSQVAWLQAYAALSSLAVAAHFLAGVLS